ncbi:unnamed protein product [Tuwongella immobilis]|uniref:Uncharacterized protein n=2 Tax=Tuwongella immobilis TaxID=692036 RepID=A0A6C2YIA8_9BACT|nr:unnamed protein product [Tuwongella immobilis]VTR97028.1 unnamed protein product [Tuwongella immobilis]
MTQGPSMTAAGEAQKRFEVNRLLAIERQKNFPHLAMLNLTNATGGVLTPEMARVFLEGGMEMAHQIMTESLRTGILLYDVPNAIFRNNYVPYNPYLAAYLQGTTTWLEASAHIGLDGLGTALTVAPFVKNLAQLRKMSAPAARGSLLGHTEWVPDPRRAGTATRELQALEATYTRETGLKPDLARRRPLGETRDAGFDPETGKIFVYDDVPPAFRDGYLAEELHHYQRVRDAGHLGKSLAEIEKIDPGFAVRMEADVLGRVRGAGFIPYDPRHYAPYTDVPRPVGVAGDTKR